MSVRLGVLVVAAAVGLVWYGPGSAATGADALPPISGMALIEGRDFLIVVDTKANSDDVRCGVVSVGQDGGYSFTPLTVPWPGERSNDLESASPVPGRQGEFLIAESGAWKDRTTGAEHAGRIFHLRLSHEAGQWEAQVLNTLPLDPALREVEGIACVQSTYDSTDVSDSEAYGIERLAHPELFSPSGWSAPAEPPAPPVDGTAAADAAKPPQLWRIVLGTRGAGVAYEPARLYFADADLDAGQWVGERLDGSDVDSSFSYGQPQNPWLRGITDMYLDPSGVLWISRAVDPGDGGPFTSSIVRYTKIGDIPDARYYGSISAEGGWTISGLKVEAIAAPVIEGSVLSFATDDESYGGVWRPLGGQ